MVLVSVVRARTPAKVNLSLLVGPKAPSGYHEVFTVLAPIDLYDEVEFALRVHPARGVRSNARGLDVTAAGPSGSAPERRGNLEVECEVAPGEANLVARALHALERETGYRFTGRVAVRKGIPTGAGLGGGSSDAALALLVGAQLIAEAGGPRLGREELRRLARALGADVAFFLDPVPSLGRGRGEILEQLALPALWLALVMGDTPLSTRKVYEVFDELAPPAHFAAFAGRVGQAEQAWRLAREASAVADLLVNDLEVAALTLLPSLREVRGAIVREGARGALMSGSGSALYGLCASEEEAADVAERLRARWGLRAQLVKVLSEGSSGGAA